MIVGDEGLNIFNFPILKKKKKNGDPVRPEPVPPLYPDLSMQGLDNLKTATKEIGDKKNAMNLMDCKEIKLK